MTRLRGKLKEASRLGNRLEYLGFNLLVISSPFLLSLFTRNEVIPRLGPALAAVLIPALLFMLWDHLVTGWFWVFNPKYLTGLKIGRLPIEEILFFITVPYASLYLWTNFQILAGPHRPLPLLLPVLMALLSAATGIRLLAGPSRSRRKPGFSVLPRFGPAFRDAIRNHPIKPGTVGLKILHALPTGSLPYTGITLCVWSLTCAADLLFGTGLFRDPLFYVFLVPLFCLTFVFNGYLTARPVVVYNEEIKTTGRIWTIPWEDFLYGFSLITLTFILYRVL
jgi:lycopene cyclase domain-containing protein